MAKITIKKLLTFGLGYRKAKRFFPLRHRYFSIRKRIF